MTTTKGARGTALVALLAAAGACREVTKEPTNVGVITTPLAEVAQDWSSLAADVTLINELVDAATGAAAGPRHVQRYHIIERKHAEGWGAVVTFEPLDQSNVPVSMRSALSAKTTVMEYAADGRSVRMSRDGREVGTRPPVDLGNMSPSFASLIPPRPRPIRTRPASLAPVGRPSVILALLASPAGSANTRGGLHRRFGDPALLGPDQERFTSSAGDTVRSITFNTVYGAIAEVRVEIAGRLHTRTSYGFGDLVPGLPGRTSITMERASMRPGGAGRLQRTTVRYSNARFEP
jgi:hypothetical protein